MARPTPVQIMLLMQNVTQAENAVLHAVDQLGPAAPADLVRMADRIRASRPRLVLAQ